MRTDHRTDAKHSTRGLTCAIGVACLTLVLMLDPAVAAPATPASAPAAAPALAPALAAATAQRAPEPTQSSVTAQALTRLEEETLVLKARLKALETEAQIAQRSAELTRLTDVGARHGFMVRAVEGISGALYATLWSREDGELEVKQGDVLPNGMRIASIQPNAVLVRPTHGGKTVALPMAMGSLSGMAADQNVAGAPAIGGAATGIPGIPPLPRY